ncbi:hypothetical protein U9M48_022542 [Paspalum notatum var. saurae]|uniref:Uncharacterized protein n=1 Tax=Paspalum notatum var. saurae TaxID=547442 RepID=A0AAQ3TIG6_PASNO
MKYDIPLLDYDTRFSLWQVKMRAILSQADLDDALDKFGNKASTSWSDEEKRRDRKALARCMLSNAGLNRRFWAEAASIACYLINRSPRIAIDKKTPIESLELLSASFLVIKLVLKVINCGIHKLKRLCLVEMLSLMKLLCYPTTLSSDAPVERQQKTSVQVEHFIDVDNTPENDTVAVQDAQILDNSPIVDDSSFVEHSSPVVQPPQHSVAASRAIGARKPVRRLIEECNIAYALSVAKKLKVIQNLLIIPRLLLRRLQQLDDRYAR